MTSSIHILISHTQFGGEGNDHFDGNYILRGSDIHDPISASVTFYGEQGDDYAAGGNGNDVLDGGTGNDRLYGYQGDDTLKGGDGNDYLWGVMAMMFSSVAAVQISY